ncbi:MAG: sodium:proton antiporter [Verrucomicrobiota bacterium]|jgi:NhaP-type Na+/H+ or K+/H+ antiporter|nr:sodium:proton antiporter [Verrucomicrobiota bacterium]
MTISFVAILGVACVMALLAKRLKLPYTVLLVVAGLAVSLLLEMEGAKVLRGHLEKIKLEPDLLLQLFLPILLFEAAFHVKLQQFLRNWRPILFLAIPGVIVGMLLTTAVFVPLAQQIRPEMVWQMGLLIAAILAATDPISVVALFKEFSVSKRLGIIIEGESLINDGIAVVLFGVVIKITADNLGLTTPGIGDAGDKVQALHVLVDFLREVFFGAAIGLAVGLVISYLTSKFDDQHIEVALTVIAAYGANVVAMELHASGVIAVVVCGMMIGNVGVKYGMSPTTREEVVSFWEFSAFLANSFVFILIGLEINLSGLWNDAGLIGIFFATMIVVRLVVVYGVHGLVRREDLRLKNPWLPVITWSGVRGSLSMVLAMMLLVSAIATAETDVESSEQAAKQAESLAQTVDSDDARTAANERRKAATTAKGKLVQARKNKKNINADNRRATILNIVYGVVLLSILIQGTTIEWLMKRVGLIVETREEHEYEMAIARRQAIRALIDNLEESEKKGNISNETFTNLHSRLLARRTANDTRMAQMLEDMPSLNNIELEMEAAQLRALEKQMYRDLEKEGDIDYDSMESLVRDVVERGHEDEDS